MRRPIAVCGLAVLSSVASFLTRPVESRPRIGLVLSGGGALGIAHVGVLEALEELHVPVDVVAATSMGSIVGGLYAAGYSPAELEHVIGSLDWHTILYDRPDRRHLPFRRKVDDLTYLTPFELGLSEARLRMPSGLILGHHLGVALRLLSLRAAGVVDFDCLPLPFRAVATNLETGEMVVLSQGDLATALRASMAVPAVFSPVEVSGKLLADGGMVRNLPTDVARAMGADVVIAVDLGQPLAAGGRPDSIATVISRAIGMLTRLNVETSLADADLVIRPELAAYGLLDFDRWREIVPKGRTAALALADQVAALAVSDDEWAAYLAHQRRQTPILRIAQVSIDPGPGLARNVVARSVRTRPGRDLDVAVLQADLERLYELGEYESVDFHLERYEDDWNLSITARRKAWGPNYLRAGLSLFTDLEGASEFNLLGAITMTRLNRLGGELKVAAQIGGAPFVSGEFYQPFTAGGPLFAALQAQGSQVKVQVPAGASSVQYRVSDQRAGLSLGLALGRFGELRAGVSRADTRAIATSSGAGSAAQQSHTDSGLTCSMVIDQMDSINFPKHGVLAGLNGYDSRPSLGSDERYRRVDLWLYGAAGRGRHSLMGFIKATSALGGQIPPGQGRALGGLFNLSGLSPNELSGSYGGVAGVLYLYRIGRLPAFGEGLYGGFSVEVGNVWQTSRAVDLGDLRRSVSLAVGADTLLGPVYLAYGVSSGRQDSYYLYVGRTF